MKFRNYCLVIMGNTKNVLIEIEKISENKPNILDATGILIATFTSSVSPKELDDWFRLNQRSFLLFDLNADTSAFNILKVDIQEGLFGFLRESTIETLEIKSVDFDDMVKKEVNVSPEQRKINEDRIKKIFKDAQERNKNISKNISESDILNMTRAERNEMVNNIISSSEKVGFDKLTVRDKKILELLVK